MRRMFLGLVMILILGIAANAQTFRGAINGTVTDPSGSSVPNAQVKATETATGIDHNTIAQVTARLPSRAFHLDCIRSQLRPRAFPPHLVTRWGVSAGQLSTFTGRLTCT